MVGKILSKFESKICLDDLGLLGYVGAYFRQLRQVFISGDVYLAACLGPGFFKWLAELVEPTEVVMSKEITIAQYIQHHMSNLAMPLFGGAYGPFWTLHLDTFFFSTLLGTIFCFTFYLAARKVTPGVPGRWQNFVEMMVEFVQQQVKESVHHVDRFIGPLALTIFVVGFKYVT